MAVVTKAFGLGGTACHVGAGKRVGWGRRGEARLSITTMTLSPRGCGTSWQLNPVHSGVIVSVCLLGRQAVERWGRTSGQKKRPPTFARPILAGCMTARNGLRGQAPDESFGEISEKPTEKDGSMQRQRCPEVDFRAADEPCSSPACLSPAPYLAALGPGIPDPPQATPPAAVRHLMPGSKLATFHGAPVACSVLRFRGPLPRSLAVRVRRASQTLRALKCLSCFRVAVDCRSWLPHRQPILLPVSHWSGSGF